MGLIYSPEEDSYLLGKIITKEIPKILKINPKVKFLEIGCGSGIQLKAAKKSGIEKKNIFSVDINIDAVNTCQKLGFNSMKSNLFSNIKEKYDIIVFNPPYLPKTENEDKESETITTGGKKGGEIINKFLIQAKKHLKENGIIFLLTSSLSQGIEWLDYKKELLAEQKMFFEKLEVWKLIL